jgi:hypothetical protein
MDHQMPIMAARIEVTITDEKGNSTRWACDQFDYVEIETFKEPQYFDRDFFTTSPERLEQLSFHVKRPRQYTIYDPRIKPTLEDGEVLDEG